MTKWLQLTSDQRRQTIANVEYETGILGKAIEKDWWVTLTLRALFQGRYGQHMVFKGGTSLSKCWKLITRLSEDIDIALAPEVLGFEYKKTPSKNEVSRLRKKGCHFTSNELKAALEEEFIKLGVPEGFVEIQADPILKERTDTDPQTLRVIYPPLYDRSEYLADEVKIEVGVRSLTMPYSTASVKSLLSENRPSESYPEEPWNLLAVAPKKTFLEKIFLLHEEFGQSEVAEIRTKRMSRHLYDLKCMMGTNVETEALSDHGLYDELINHRKHYQRDSRVNYESLHHSSISFIPPTAVMDEYRKDYSKMQEEMIYGASVTFEEIIESLTSLQGKIRNR